MYHPYPPFPYLFKIGDFVKCSYDYGLTWWVFDEKAEVFYGIVLERNEKDDYFPYGVFYKVICTDGHVRFFAEWEMQYVEANKIFK